MALLLHIRCRAAGSRLVAGDAVILDNLASREGTARNAIRSVLVFSRLWFAVSMW
jgi:hypothetical protein